MYKNVYKNIEIFKDNVTQNEISFIKNIQNDSYINIIGFAFSVLEKRMSCILSL